MPEENEHDWHVVEVGDRFGMPGRVEIRRQGQALFVRRNADAPATRIMDLGGNPPLICETCGEPV
jgi:hypothetical protein